LFILDHNFRTRNTRKSFEVTKDSHLSLVSNKNFSEKLQSNSLGPGPGEVGEGGLKSSTYDVNFFHCKL